MRYTKSMSVHREDREYAGRIYYRYPKSTNPSDRHYFRTHGWRGIPRFLHRDVWEDANGPIPDGHHIHHIDGDTGNNDLTNLECIDAAAHWAHHDEINRKSDEWWEKSRARMDHARKFASEWHGSEEGRAWHSEHGKKAWEAREPKAATCEHCGNAYESHFPRGFCSNKCRAAARRASGVDDVDRECVNCGKTFRINKYTKTKTCSRKCGQQYRREHPTL